MVSGNSAAAADAPTMPATQRLTRRKWIRQFLFEANVGSERPPLRCLIRSLIRSRAMASRRLDHAGPFGNRGIMRGPPMSCEVEHLVLALPAQIEVAIRHQHLVAERPGLCNDHAVRVDDAG